MEIKNHTPFAAAQTVFLDKSAAEQLVVVLKATYAISERGQLTVAEEQLAIEPGDTFHGEPDKSSIKQEAEMTPPKPSTDAFLIADAVAPAPRTRWVEVHFRVGPRTKSALVMGNRHWLRSMGSVAPSEPEPFERMPIVWENAFGGTDLSAENPKHHAWEPRNPVGQGFRSAHSRAPWEGVPLPNVGAIGETLDHPDKRTTPVGFRPIGRGWQPRVSYAGTYDQAWTEKRMPLLPKDFDERFHNAAPPDLVMPGYLGPGEWVDVHGCTPGGRVFFQLPAFVPALSVKLSGPPREVPMSCDTVTVDTNRMLLLLLWKGMLRVHGEVPRLEATTLSARAGTVA
jgi:hypothetical protein